MSQFIILNPYLQSLCLSLIFSIFGKRYIITEITFVSYWCRASNFIKTKQQIRRTFRLNKNCRKCKEGYGVLECLSRELTAKGFELKIDWTAFKSPDLAAVCSSSLPPFDFCGLPINSFRLHSPPLLDECSTSLSASTLFFFSLW